jgi:hypothetical protein
MLTRKRKLKYAALVIVALGLAWVIYDPCYCWSFDTGLKPPLHLRTLPAGCEVLRIPETWTTPEGDVIWSTRDPLDWTRGELFEEVEFRLNPDSQDQVLVALRSRAWASDYHVIPRNSKQKYAFRLPALSGHPEQKIQGLHLVSDSEWSRGTLLPRVWDDLGQESEFAEFQISNSPMIAYQGKTFPRSDRFYWFTPALLSAAKRRLVVFSYGNTEIKGNEVLDPDWLRRPWRNYTANIYDVASGTRLAQIRTWSCGGGEFRDAEWHGDRVFSMPVGSLVQQILVCGFK